MAFSRNYLMDNMKAILILCVLAGHGMEAYIESNYILKGSYAFLYLFHMSLFIFISGYFSKKENSAHSTAVRNYLFPYIFFNLLAYVGKYLINGTFDVSWINPAWTMWYLFIIFAYRFTLKYITKIPFHLPLSVLLGILISCFSNINNDLIIRFFAYLPWFLLGYHTKQEHLSLIKRKTPSILAIFILLSFWCLMIWFMKEETFRMALLYNDSPYHAYDVRLLSGCIIRAINYAAAFVVGICLIRLLPEAPCSLSSIGKNSGCIYIFHSYFIRLLKAACPEWPQTTFGQCLIIAYVAFVFIISSNRFAVLLYDKLHRLWLSAYDISIGNIKQYFSPKS